MARKMDEGTVVDPEIAMSVDDLRGCAVWTEAGDRVGTLRGFKTEDGRVVALEVQHGWFMGSKHVIDAANMRMEHGDVVVPSSSVADIDFSKSKHRSKERAVVTPRMSAAAAAPSNSHVLVAGRTGAKARHGGMDPAAGLLGALVAFATFILLGGLLAAIFNTELIGLSTSTSLWDDFGSEALAVGAVTLAMSLFVGGWAAGRIARFDGIMNGFTVAFWVVAVGAVFLALGAWVGDEYNVLEASAVPQFEWSSDVTFWGIVGMLAAFALMCVSAAFGGWLGSMWNHMVDNSMLRAVPIGGTTDGVRYDDELARSSSTVAHEDVDRRDVGVVGTPAGSPVAPRPIPLKDSSDDVLRPR